jgi:hypothetical protein
MDPYSDLDPDADPDPHPARFLSVLQLQDIKNHQVLCLVLFKGAFTSFFKDKKS